MPTPPWYRPPTYLVVADDLRERIRSGELAAGVALPSETAMRQRYGISRPTIRRVVGQLRAEGLVVTVQGRGTFVRSERSRHRVRLPAGSSLTVRMPTPEEAALYGIPGGGTPVLVIEREGRRPVVLPADRIVVVQ